MTAVAGGDASGIDQLLDVIERLRAADDGCAWCGEQDHRSLVRYLVEEAYELVDAIESGDALHLKEELGDVLYQVVFHASLASADPAEGFDFDAVAGATAAKMRGRHPEVFAAPGGAGRKSAADVVAGWDAIKAAEKTERTSVLDGVPLGMPALALADKVIGKAAKAGVTVPAGGTEAADERALGAELLSIVAAARARGLDPERALREAIRALSAEVRAVEGQDG